MLSTIIIMYAISYPNISHGDVWLHIIDITDEI